MTDVHCHLSGEDPSVCEWLIGRDFVGTHPWEADSFVAADLVARLQQNAALGVGEIGLDRLHDKEIPPIMRAAFETQLQLAAEYGRPVVLHGAKCWGQVVAAITRLDVAGRIPAFVFHGFSRSDGLIPDIVALGGYISVGPAIMNDHAVNYRQLVRKIPKERLLIETDRTEATPATVGIREVAGALSAVLGITVAELEAIIDVNAAQIRPPRNAAV